jgi:hypothetical protein
MPNLFGPELLFVGSIVSPFVLRVIVSISLLYLAFYVFKRMTDIRSRVFAGLQALLAILIALGAFTQPAALLGMVVFGWNAVVFKGVPSQPESRGFYILLTVIAFLLALVGAGAVAAFDIPL